MTREWTDLRAAEASALRRATAVLEQSADRHRLMSQGNFRRLYLRLLADRTRPRPAPRGPTVVAFDCPPGPGALWSVSVASGELRLAERSRDDVGRIHRTALAAYRARVLPVAGS